MGTNGSVPSETAYIRGMGHYFPERMVTNDDIARLLDPQRGTKIDHVVGNVNTHARHWVGENETEIDLGVKATQMALEDANLSPQDIDILIATNWTGRLYAPEMAPRISTLCGIGKILSFDICGSCTGFVLGVQTAWNYLKTGNVQRIVVVAAEAFSRCIRPGSIGHFIAGDGAGAIILERTTEQTSGLIDVLVRSDGSAYEKAMAEPPHGWGVTAPDFVQHAIETSAWAVEQMMERNQLTIDDVDWVVSHPGTTAIYEGVKSRLGIPDDKFIVNFPYRGNTSSASIPTVLSEFYHQGKFKRGDLFLSSAVGSGWFQGSLLYRL